ncbi:MAG: trypsin-like peptidase domain-containing protein [Aggregatilineales bacterium]
MNRLLRQASLILLAVMLIAFGFFVGTSALPNMADTIDYQEVAVSQVASTLTPQDQLFSSLYQNVSPSVVAISVTAQRTDIVSGQRGIVEGSGSGFVIDQLGHIVTNAHVVDGATELVVNFFDGTIVRADVVGVDLDSDLAVIQVDLPQDRLVPVTFGNVDNVIVGQTVLAIGSPFGQRWTLTTGIVSAVNRRISGLTDFSIGSAIQTDAPINPGNSGGPLINLAGQVIGVNSQILSQSGSNSGVGFAIPSDLTVRVANELIENGAVQYSYIGIGIGIRGISDGDVNLGMIEALNLPNNLRGVVVGDVLAGGPAQQAGLQAPQGSFVTGLQSADIITAIEGEPIDGFNQLVSYLARNTVPGQTVQLTVYRNGNMVTIPVTLSARPGN